jgi:hypothetical protein
VTFGRDLGLVGLRGDVPRVRVFGELNGVGHNGIRLATNEHNGGHVQQGVICHIGADHDLFLYESGGFHLSNVRENMTFEMDPQSAALQSSHDVKTKDPADAAPRLFPNT